MKTVHPSEFPSINVLITGPAKRGKTNAAASAPGKVLYNNFDLPNATRLIHRRFGEAILEPALPAYEGGQRRLFAHMIEVAKIARDPEPLGVQTVVVDPVGELYRRLLEEFANRSVRPSLPTYGEVSVQVERFCRGLCESPAVNTVLVCHEMLQQDGEELVSIPFTGTKSGSADLGAKLQSMVDVVAYAGVIETQGNEHFLGRAASRDGSKLYVSQLIPYKGRLGGDRFDCLGDWRPSDISDWVEAIMRYEAGEEIERFDLDLVGAATNKSKEEKR
jgi:hypothetical protein